MKYVVLIALLFTATPRICAQQILSLKLAERSWDAQRKRFNIRRTKAENTSVTPETPLFLKNGMGISRYADFRLTVQQPSETTEYSFLSVMVAATQDASLVFVVDQNNNQSFADDEPYTVSMENEVTSWDDFFRRLPMITLDSIKVFTFQQKPVYKTIRFKLGVARSDGNYFRTLREIKEAADYFLDVYTVDYYSAMVQRDEIRYEFAVALNPVVHSFMGYPGTSKTDGAIFFYRALPDKDTTLAVVPIGKWDVSNRLMHNRMQIGRDTYRIRDLSLARKELQLVKSTPGDESLPEPETAGPALSSLLSDSTYTLLEFSGSWCKPCQLILPKMKELFHRYGTRVRFVTIAVESNAASAKRYHAETGVAWPMVYENLNCESVDCLKRQLEIGGYPALLLFDREKKVRYRGEGTIAVEDVTAELQKLVGESR